MPVKDTIKLTDENGKSGKAREEISYGRHRPAGLCSRASVSGIRKTDAAFHRRNHRRCHGCGAGDGNRISDGKSGYENIKITTPEDLLVAESFLAEK